MPVRSGPTAVSLALLVLLGACAGLPGAAHDTVAPTEPACRSLADALDEAVRRAGTGDAQDTRVAGARWLRAGRFEASFAAEPLAPAAASAWLERLRAADAHARRVEVANLPEAQRSAIAAAVAPHPIAAAIERCGRIETGTLAADADALARLRAAVRVPDDYVDWQRAVGLYPVAALAFGAGVRREEAAMQASFARHAGRIAEGTTRFAPAREHRAPAVAAADAARQPALDALGVPMLDAAHRAALLAAHAPVFALAGSAEDDRFGRLLRDGPDRVRVDTAQPQVYVRIAFTRWEGAVRVQLVYTAWFPRRAPVGPIDLLAGHLDGVMLRLTLDERGRVAMVDSIHACGCWHLFVPVGARRARPAPDPSEEWAFSPAVLHEVPSGARVRVRLAARTHAVEGIDTVDDGQPADAGYALADDDLLRTLPDPAGGSRSLFDPRGRVTGTERAERWLFWPMGIANAGSMRQWGRHATAFVGRRHFDDAALLERRFGRRAASPLAGDE
jgi:hypothetical protein